MHHFYIQPISIYVTRRQTNWTMFQSHNMKGKVPTCFVTVMWQSKYVARRTYAHLRGKWTGVKALSLHWRRNPVESDAPRESSWRIVFYVSVMLWDLSMLLLKMKLEYLSNMQSFERHFLNMIDDVWFQNLSFYIRRMIFVTFS